MDPKSPKKVANRASLTRQPTTGPLEGENNLSVPGLPSPQHSAAGGNSGLSVSRSSPLSRSPVPAVPQSPSNYRYNADDPEPQTKDLSFLLHPSFYLPVSQLEVPPRFRVQLKSVRSAATIPESLAELEKLLSGGDFLLAAHLAAEILTSAELDSTEIKTISDLLLVRYSCLELTGNIHMAAQESKALEDLNSEFYYVYPSANAAAASSSSSSSKELLIARTSSLPNHILPFPLRLQAARLQSIGFSDPRRAISALYDLGVECRQHIALPGAPHQEREVWERRLGELGVRVVNALIEVNDVACAARTLKTLRKPADTAWRVRMGLLLMKIGDLSVARELLEGSSEKGSEMEVLFHPLLATAEGRFDDAARQWETLFSQAQSESQRSALRPIIQQNLAVTYIYAGRLKEAVQLMEAAVDQRQSYGSLTFNLATAYELSSERSADLKMQLADQVVSQSDSTMKGWAKINADFKL